ncbi:MAG: hydantoinase/oxoprolinase family protein [Desulfobacterales bacterium]|nr:hydantoinase/oxoprolinase family protein [Desulfobacterales bacterium]
MIIGLDVGGTHTDVVLVGENGLERQVKVLTNTTALFQTVLTGLEKITADIDPRQIKHAVLSTTLTTNAIVQRKLPPAAMIVSSGPGIDPDAFRTGGNYFVVSGSIDHSGREIQPVNRREIETVARKIQSEGISHVGVVGKFSARNPAHEIQIADILKPYAEKIFLGHKISGHLNFPRRIDTTFLNASVYPVHKNFFEAVQASLKHKGITVPIYILKADGGTMAFEASVDFPGQSVLSGPSASVMGSLAFAPENAETIVMDIGGTTTDMAVLINRVPLLDPLGIELGGYKTLIRALRSYSIGIGGDSLVTCKDKTLKIGPERQGPAMAYGGPKPTPTDALFVLGKAGAGDRDRAAEGIKTIADELGVSVEEAARMVFDKTCLDIMASADDMVRQINKKPVYTIKELLKGHQVKPSQILVLGGPAPYFAERLEKISGCTVAKVPAWSVANAIGTALSRTTCEVTLFADTQKGIILAPEESFSQSVKPNFTQKEALELGHELLKQKARRLGADMSELEIDVLEDLEFNMVRGFRLTGKNIRIKLQVKPGLIRGYKDITDKISAGAEIL